MGHNPQIFIGLIDTEVAMTTEQQISSGGGLLSKLVIVVLLAATIGLYLKIVMLEDQPQTVQRVPQASVQVVEDQVSSVPASAAPLKDLPDDQISLIKQVFAPELR